MSITIDLPILAFFYLYSTLRLTHHKLSSRFCLISTEKYAKLYLMKYANSYLKVYVCFYKLLFLICRLNYILLTKKRNVTITFCKTDCALQ